MVDATTQAFINNYSGSSVRVAFPGYRVFIFGYEVTDDVVEVRVNNSGGSAERTAGTCSFSLVNPQDKYILNYSDMIYIGKSSAAYKEFKENQWRSYGLDGSTPEDVKKIIQELDTNLYNTTFDELAGYVVTDTTSDRQTEQEQLVEADKKIDAAYKKIAANLTEHSKAYPFSATRLGGFPAPAYGDMTIKAQVVNEKLVFTSDIAYDPDSNLNKLENRTILKYPMQQGDCIFHPNDPVRVAFRDPFDPRIWYWAFTGFMDAYTETQGENKDSVLTINCTDVTKMARYTFIQLGVGLADPNIENVVSALKEESAAGVQYFKELFAMFTMQEVLETLFFGTQSTLTTLEDAVASQIAGMSDEAIKQYMSSNFPEYTVPSSVKYKESPEDLKKEAIVSTIQRRKTNIARAGKLSPISVPAPYMQGVSKGAAATENIGSHPYDENSEYIIAKRCNSQYGVTTYFYGDTSLEDRATGEEISNLYRYNEILHHRVRTRDLYDMALDPGEFAGSFNEQPATKIIDIIGKDKKKFPVGHGRVFYTSRARFAEGDFARQIVDRSMGGTSGLFSTFRDMLSYIYDMAERADFRFYATPKGDFVFELPFYDFDPIHFLDDGVENSEVAVSQVDAALQKNDGITFSKIDLAAMGFTRDYSVDSEAVQLVDYGDFDYASCFTIEREEQTGFSNTSTDNGVFTVFRCKPNIIASYAAVDGKDITENVWIADKGSIPTLGLRVNDTDTWGFITSGEDAKAYAALTMARVNAEAKNAAVATLPKFGLMVNRPIFWRARNYYANIVSLSHSIIWNSTAETTVNMNSIRGWGGEVDANTGRPIHRHFSGTDLPFSMGELSKQSTKTNDTQG